MSQVCWLSSYPKSGNTWFRIFLTCLLNEDNGELDINNLGYPQYPNKRDVFDEINGFCSTDLSLQEINRIRPINLSWLLHAFESPQYYKTHAAYTYNDDGSPVLGLSTSTPMRALYFVRNPLDVCISFAHHGGVSIDEAIESLNKSLISHGNNTGMFIPEKVLSWSQHTKSWVDAANIDVKVVRYEDMLTSSTATFTAACRFLGLDVSQTEVNVALKMCEFETLKKMETESGFSERPNQSKQFFRKGIAGDWVETLASYQIQKVINQHQKMMQYFGYLDREGRPRIC